MALIGYLGEDTEIAPAQFNALASELDKMLRILFSGHSWLVFADPILGSVLDGLPMGRKFYFGDDTERKILLPELQTYDHAAMTAAAAALTVYGTDAAKQLAFVDPEAESLIDWPLDASLAAHTRTIDGVVYYLTAKEAGDAPDNLPFRERHRKLDVAEIIVEGWPGSETHFVWGETWDKYHFIRFHNLDNATLNVDLPGLGTLAIPKFGVQAVRRKYPAEDEWEAPFQYLWGMKPGDSWIWDGIKANNVASLLSFHQWLGVLTRGITEEGGTPGLYMDPRVVWNAGSLLAQPIAGGTMAGKYFFHLGEILTFAQAATTGTSLRAAPASWAELLGTGTAAIGVKGVITDGELTMEAMDPGDEPIDAVGLGSNLFPLVPVTLPYVVPEFGQPVNTRGAEPSDLFCQGAFVEEGETVFVSFTHNGFVEGLNSGWQPLGHLGIRLWHTLDQFADIEPKTEGEGTSEPAITWISDGLRLCWHCVIDYSVHLGLIPKQTECAAISSNLVSVPYGGQISFGGVDPAWETMIRRHPRRLSDWVGFVDPTTEVRVYTANPDVKGHAGLAGGVDWNEERLPNAESEVKRAGSPPPQIETRNLPVRPRNDAADRIAAHAEDEGWYPDKRDGLKAGGLEEEDVEKLVRVPIWREHFNHVAQRLNAIMAIRPFTLFEMVWWGALVDGTEIDLSSDVNIVEWPPDAIYTGNAQQNYPPGFFCAVAAEEGTSRAEEAHSLFPSSITREGNVMRWISVAQVTTVAESMGVPWFFERWIQPTALGAGDLAGETNGGIQLWQHLATFDGAAYFTPCLGEPVSLGDLVTLDEGTPFGVILDIASGGGGALAGAVRLEQAAVEGPLPPEGWTFDGASRVLIEPFNRIAFTTDPIPSNPYNAGGNLNPLEIVEAASGAFSAKFWTVAQVAEEMPLEITAAGIAALYGGTLPDPRCLFRLSLLRRFLYVRTTT